MCNAHGVVHTSVSIASCIPILFLVFLLGGADVLMRATIYMALCIGKRKVNVTVTDGIVEAFNKHWSHVESLLCGHANCSSSNRNRSSSRRRRQQQHVASEAEAAVPSILPAHGEGVQEEVPRSINKSAASANLNSSMVMDATWWSLWKDGLLTLVPNQFGVRAVKAYECADIHHCVGVVMHPHSRVGTASVGSSSGSEQGDCICYNK